MNMSSRRLIIRHARKSEPVVWLIDSEQWPRVCLRAELIERGYDACGFMTISDALGSLSKGTSPKPESIILELRGQHVTNQSLMAIRNLRIPTILLGGGIELNDPIIHRGKWAVILKRPVSLGTIAETLQKMLSSKANSIPATTDLKRSE
jgi:hypothetical protein